MQSKQFSYLRVLKTRNHQNGTTGTAETPKRNRPNNRNSHIDSADHEISEFFHAWCSSTVSKIMALVVLFKVFPFKQTVDSKDFSQINCLFEMQKHFNNTTSLPKW